MFKIGLSEALHYELFPLGVRVKIIEPGAIKTDFAGRSFDFNSDPDLTEYQAIEQSLFSTFALTLELASEPEVVAEVIFRAVNDKSNKIRYEAIHDAEQLLADRRAADDETFLGAIRAQFGITKS